MSLGWPPTSFAILLFLGFTPLLLLESEISKRSNSASKLVLLKHIYPAFLLWNILTTWWIYKASIAGAIMANFANALLMTIPFLLFHQTKKTFGDRLGYFSLIVFWLTFEHLHLRWELTWPWLTLGNGLAKFPEFVQWYEFTGTSGGSLWILTTNLIAFFALRKIAESDAKSDRAKNFAHNMNVYFVRFAVQFLLAIAIPVLISLLMYRSYQERGKKVEAVAVQPNIDPYNEKYGNLTSEEQREILKDLTAKTATAKTAFIAWPETAILGSLWLHRLKSNKVMNELRVFGKNFPDATFIIGAFTYKNFGPGDKLSPSARPFERTGKCCYDAFNSAVQFDNKTDNLAVYHKSKLVPGVERMPYPGAFKFLGNLAIDLGGISGSLGMQDEREVFFSPDGVGTAPVICYESVFGDYVADYIRKGAQAIIIITNDGWWGNTPGHRQHLHYASLRAIETRRSIVRSANTGISCFINQRGDILQATEYNERIAVKGEVQLNDEITFYVRFGDYLGWLAVFASMATVIAHFCFFVKNTR